MSLLFNRSWAIVKAALLGFAILIFGAGIWAVLVQVNLTTTPAIPWSVPAMAVVLWCLWRFLQGSFWPHRTSASRHLCMRANLVPPRQFAWAALAGALAVIALAGLWIVLFELVPMPLNALPDFSRYPLWTVVALVLMGALAAPLTEEPAFRGYCQVILERQFNAPIAIALSSIFFALAHGPTQGFLWPKLLFYFLVGITFGVIAFLTRSILPAIPAHIFGLLVFFTLIWPHDATRRQVWLTGTDTWFWIHVAQALIFAASAIWALCRLVAVVRTAVPTRTTAVSVQG